MALIKCPECQKEVSDTAKNCIHCGYLMIKDLTLPEKLKKHKKKLFITGSAIIAALLVVILFTADIPGLTGAERIALDHIKMVQNELLFPETMRLYEVLISENYTDKGTATYISFAANNRSGRLTDDRAVVFGGTVYFDSDPMEIAVTLAQLSILREIEALLTGEEPKSNWEIIDEGKLQNRIK